MLPNVKFDNHNQPIDFSILNDLNLSLTFESLYNSSAVYNGKYILTIDGLSSEEQAAEYKQKVLFGMFWVLLRRNIVFKVGFDEGSDYNLNHYSSEINQETRDDKKPSVYRKDSKPRFIPSSEIRVTPEIPFDDYKKYLTEGIRHSNTKNVLEDDKLLLALELYNQHFQENSMKAQFLTLVTILEVLSAPKEKDKEEEENEKGDAIINELVNKWIKALEKRIESIADSDIKEGLVKFKTQKIEKLLAPTIEKQIKAFVINTLKSDGNSRKKAKSKADKALKIYNTRSELVHSGKTDHDKLITSYIL